MSFTYYVIKNEDINDKLKNDGRMINLYMVQNPPQYDDVINEQPL